MEADTQATAAITSCPDTARELARAREVYGGHRYGADLVAFAHQQGWHVHPTARHYCAQLLVDPHHRRGRYGCLNQRGLPADIDHPVLLRQGPVSAPTAWAVLSQPYREQASGEHLGDAPYGLGTQAFLIDARHVPEAAN